MPSVYSLPPLSLPLSLSHSLTLPPLSDPYKMPPRKSRDREGEEVTSRPPTVKADDLRSMEVLDEEEGGWAGHHEEVDYSKVRVL